MRGNRWRALQSAHTSRGILLFGIAGGAYIEGEIGVKVKEVSGNFFLFVSRGVGRRFEANAFNPPAKERLLLPQTAGFEQGGEIQIMERY
jgi:hypothetical protein